VFFRKVEQHPSSSGLHIEAAPKLAEPWGIGVAAQVG
jgi:hypothetical protein